MNYKNNSFIAKRKAFTLIELLIVIAIIGILFIVLVSKVDFATDKAKASGVQTDFRSFQMAFDTVAKENAGFNTFGWDTGDANQDGIRNSYDEGDNGAGGGIAKNGIQDGDEVFTGHKVYAETFSKVYSLKKNGTGSYDRDALNRLETAINANLDPKLHITIKDDGEIVMANGAQDPWNKEYHGWYITNAEVDGKDRGAFVMYSDGANNEFGSAHAIADGKVTVTVPNGNKDGKDDYSIVSCYTYLNGYGEVKNMTTGFSNNQSFLSDRDNEFVDIETIEKNINAVFNDGTSLSWSELMLEENGTKYGYNAESITTTSINSNAFLNCSTIINIIIPEGITTIGSHAFDGCVNLTSIFIAKTVSQIDEKAFYHCNMIENIYIDDLSSWCSITFNDKYSNPLLQGGLYLNNNLVTNLTIPNDVTKVGDYAFYGYDSLTSLTIPDNVTKIGRDAFEYCVNLTSVTIGSGLTTMGYSAFYFCSKIEKVYISDINAWLNISFVSNYSNPQRYGNDLYLNDQIVTEIIIPDDIKEIGYCALQGCESLTSIVISDSVTYIADWALAGCTNLKNIVYTGTIEQWNAMYRQSGWNDNVPAEHVICSNGTIEIK